MTTSEFYKSYTVVLCTLFSGQWLHSQNRYACTLMSDKLSVLFDLVMRAESSSHYLFSGISGNYVRATQNRKKSRM